MPRHPDKRREEERAEAHHKFVEIQAAHEQISRYEASARIVFLSVATAFHLEAYADAF